MKKFILSLILAVLLAGNAFAATVSKSFTAIGAGPSLSVKVGDSFTYSVSGTFSGTVYLQRSTNGFTWSTVATATGSASGTVIASSDNANQVQYRFWCDAYVSGTIVTTLTEATGYDVPVDQWKNKNGDVVAYTTENGLVVQNLTVTGTSTGTGGGGSSSFGVLIGSGAEVITTGAKTTGLVRIPTAGTITGWEIESCDSTPTTGSIVIDIWKDTYANFPPTVADTITASAKPTLTSGTKASSTTLTGWTTAIAAGDIIYFNVDSVSSLTCAKLSVDYTAQ